MGGPACFHIIALQNLLQGAEHISILTEHGPYTTPTSVQILETSKHRHIRGQAGLAVFSSAYSSPVYVKEEGSEGPGSHIF